MMQRRTGFTLIELLIVVSIIAILAAIAVPNFLEAQVRAKVSRAKADQRTFATAVESYSIDYNKPPTGGFALTVSCKGYVAELINQPCTSRQIPANSPYHQAAQAQLTTPVAYLTSILLDPFSNVGSINRVKNTQAGGQNYKYDDWYLTTKYIGPTSSWATSGRQGITWAIYGIGPSRNAAGSIHTVLNGAGNPPQTTCAYDPSNGTVSEGWIIRTNKGPFTAAGQ